MNTEIPLSEEVFEAHKRLLVLRTLLADAARAFAADPTAKGFEELQTMVTAERTAREMFAQVVSR